MAVGGRGGEFYIENAEIMERIAPEKSWFFGFKAQPFDGGRRVWSRTVDEVVHPTDCLLNPEGSSFEMKIIILNTYSSF